LKELPFQREALRILRAAGCSPNVIEHCKIVSMLATEMAEECIKKGLTVDQRLVEIGSLLHDIGRSETHGVEHGVRGGAIAKSLGLPEALVKIIVRHVGAGISPDEARELRFPEGDYVPSTLEEKIVAYADKLVEGNKRIDIGKTVRKFSEELGSRHPSVGRLKELDREFSRILEH
jgi:uncharacterized protein